MNALLHLPAVRSGLLPGLAGVAGIATLAALLFAPVKPLDGSAAETADRAPSDPAYRSALRLGLDGDLAAARREMERIAAEAPGGNRSAWALYQAALAARAAGDEEGAEELAERLTREAPDHPLAARLTGAAAPPPQRAALSDCGPRSLLHLAARSGISTDLPALRRLCRTSRAGTTMEQLALAARRLGFRADPLQVDRWHLERKAPAGIAWVDGNHYVAFRPAGRESGFHLFDPNAGAEVETTASELTRRSQGIVLILHPGAGSAATRKSP